MDLNPQLTTKLIIVGVVGCIAIDLLIYWPVNLWWSRHHSDKQRHPFSPAFTAIGVLWVLFLSSYLVKWQDVQIILAGFIIFGGVMWILHAIRWLIRDPLINAGSAKEPERNIEHIGPPAD